MRLSLLHATSAIMSNNPCMTTTHAAVQCKSCSFHHFVLELVAVLLTQVMLCMGALPLAPTFWTLLPLYAYTVLLPLISVLHSHSATPWGHPAARQAQHAPQLTLLQVQGALNLGSPHKM